MPSIENLIDDLTAELEPRRTVSPAIGRLLLFAAALVTSAVVISLFGMRPDFLSGHPQPVSLITTLVILSAGIAVGAALTAMARPAVGALRGGWQWSVAALAVLPVAAVLTAAGSAAARAAMLPPEGPPCLIVGTLASILSIVCLTLWLRRGAPSSPERASWMVGIASGAVGAVAIGLACPIDSITHIGVWHGAIIAVTGVGCRLLLPRFLRW